MIRKKKRAFKLSKRSRKDVDFHRYRSLSNKVRDLTRQDHRQHLDDITKDLSTNQRPFWRWLKNISAHFKVLPDLYFNGNVLSSAKDKVEAFNDYFSSVFTCEDHHGLERLRSEQSMLMSTSHIDEVVITEEDVYEFLCKIDTSKACGPDEIPGQLLKEGAPLIAEPLSILFNNSLQFGSLPRDWISANVTPVFKKGDKHLPKNYRPISLTSLVVKLMEKIIYRKRMDFLLENNKLNPYQHGFRQHHSCQTQLIETIHCWANALDRGLTSHIIFLDFAKAFDTVPHQRLILKLEQMGVRGSLLLWLKAFLINRRQHVIYNDDCSRWINVSSGVPQGSILGPLLFLVYINDIGEFVQSSIRLFADDCVIFREVNSRDDTVLLQKDLKQIYDWSQKWLLTLSTSKCKALCISNKKSPLYCLYYINSISLEWVDSFRYLGVRIDHKLKWASHVADITVKASKILNLLRRSMYTCSMNAKERAYLALVRPHLEFCAPVWNPHQQKEIETLEKVQRRAVRWICSARWDPSTFTWSKRYDEALKDLHWPTLELRRHFLSLCQIYKIVHNLACISFFKYFAFKTVNTRSHKLSLLCKSSKLNSFRYSFFINAPFIWNKLPFEIVSLSSYSNFKNKLMNFML